MIAANTRKILNINVITINKYIDVIFINVNMINMNT